MTWFETEAQVVVGGDYWVGKPFQFGIYADTLPNGEPDTSSAFTPEDLSVLGGWLAQWRVKAKDAVALDLVVNTSQLADGIVNVEADEVTTRAMARGGVYDIQATTPRVRTLVIAPTSWQSDVTR